MLHVIFFLKIRINKSDGKEIEMNRIIKLFTTVCVIFLMFFSTNVFSADSKIVIGLNSDARSLDPVITNDQTTIRVLRHIYDSLFFWNRDMKVVPMLAETYEMTDPLTWTIKLRKGITFHNGEPFTAEAVKVTYDFVLNKENKSLVNTLINRIAKVEIVDDHTVKFITSEPFLTLPENAIEIFIAPPKLVKEKGMASLTDNPCGTGPYKLKRWLKDRQIELEVNKNYWQGEPKIKDVVFKIIPEIGPRVSALIVGEVDLIPDVPSHLIARVNSSGAAKVKAVPSRRIVFIAIDNINEGPMRDIRVRQALNYGVNVDELISAILEGQATRTAGPLVSINKDYDTSLKPYPYDPAKAKALLKEAGYGKGLNITFHACQDRYLKDKEFAQAIAAQLSEIGVNVTLKFHEWGTYLQMVKADKAGDMHIMGRSDRELEGGIMYAWFKSGASWVAFKDAEIDDALAKYIPILEPKERKEGLYTLQKMIQEKAPWIFLWQQHDLYGVSNRINWEPRADEQFYIFEAGIAK